MLTSKDFTYTCALFNLCRNVINYRYNKNSSGHEIKVLEINVNLMENDFQIKKINAKEEVTFAHGFNLLGCHLAALLLCETAHWQLMYLIYNNKL